MGHRQRAVAVIGYSRGHGEHASVVLNASLVGAAAHLAQHVAVGAGLGVSDQAQRHTAVCTVGARGHYVVAFKQLERKLTSSHIAPRKLLRHLNLVGHARIGRLHGIRVGEGERRVGSSTQTLHRQFSVAVVGHLEAHGLRFGVVGYAIGRAAFRHLVGEGMRTDNASPCDRLIALSRCLVGIFGASNLICSRRNGSCACAFARHYCSALALLGGIRSCRVALLFAIGTCSTSLIGRTLTSSIGGSLLAGSSLRFIVGISCTRAVRTQRLVQVIERKFDIAKINVAVGIVGCCSALRHRSRWVVGRYREGELALNACGGQALAGLQVLDAGKAHLNRTACGVHVLEHQAVARRISRCGKCSVTVIHNHHREHNRLRLSGNATRQDIGFFVSYVINLPRRLTVLHRLYGIVIRYQLGKAFGGVFDAAKINVATGVVGCRSHIFNAAKVFQRKIELAVSQATASQALGSSNAYFARSCIAVVERYNCRFLGGGGVAAVHIRLAVLRVTRYRHNRGCLQRAIRRIALNGNRYRAFCRVVGVATRRRALLNHLIAVGFTRVSLR